MKKLLLSSAIILTTASISAYTITRPTSADTDLPIQVQHQQAELDNHEARITNTEKDVQDLQANTNTPSSPEHVDVPEVVTPAATEPPAAPTPEPITVVSYEQIPIENSEDIDCKYTYSDGTTKQWHWKVVTYNQGSKNTKVSGFCDNRAIGRDK